MAAIPAFRERDLVLDLQKIRQRRKELGLSMEQAAKKAGITWSMWIKIERGERLPSLRVATRVARVLGVGLDYLLAS